MNPLPLFLRLVFFLSCCGLSVAAEPAAGGEDARYGELRDLNGYFPFGGGAGSKEEWAARSEEIVRRVKVASGIWPEPTKTPLRAVIHGARDMGDYTVEKVYFESLPGNFVTGNLYRPAGESLAHGVVDGVRPAVLCPHGHWPKGRFLDQGSETRVERQVRQAIGSGAERFESAARSPLQARCVQLARMGCVVFHYDMLAEADAVQFLSHKVAPRESMNSLKAGEWGFASPAAAARLQTSFGLQTWNSVRAVDFLLTLKEVDPDRIGVTGASGGGTQTMMAAAVDDRIDAAFPCVMPSTSMQGGCTCENTHLLRIGQGNIDIAAARAPLPLGMTAADDWTIELETKGHPDLVALYKMLGQPKNYEAHFNIHFKHNYNHVSRTQMYDFLNRHFKLGFEDPVLERDFEFLDGAALTVWDGEHPRPSGPEVGDTHERAVCRWMTADAAKQMRPLLNPKDAAAAAQAREVIGGAVDVMIGRKAPEPEMLEHELLEKNDRGGYTEMTGILHYAAEGERVALTHFFPKDWNGKAVLWVHPKGKASLFGADGSPRLEAMRLVDAGYAVVGADLFRQDEKGAKNRDVSAGVEIKPGSEWRRSSLYTYGYNDALFAQRVHDVMAVAAFIKGHPKWETKELTVVGLEGAGHWAAAAKANVTLDPDATSARKEKPIIDRVAADLRGFRFAKLADDFDADFLPGGAKYGDVAGMLVLSAPGDLWVAGIDKAAAGAVRQTYAVSKGDGEAVIYEGDAKDAAAKAIDWVLGE